MLAIGTGQRGIDQIAMRWSAYNGSAIEVVPEKTSTTTGARVWMPCHAVLRRALDTAPKRAVTILCRPDGQPWKIDHFRHEVGTAIKAAGLGGVVWHGLRATAAAWMAEAGCTDAEIGTVLKQATLAMARHYRRNADQTVRAGAAITKLEAARKLPGGNGS